ncbi:type II secretion system protein [Pararhodospirillum photometricum]|uniref:type II secretion system protein n=1 Tax=Pararhodospirillum photometricum TaxID=1084 RepID=UPI000319BCEF|nr:type II secretion system protein [Pararhodospirillum photometricum]
MRGIFFRTRPGVALMEMAIVVAVLGVAAWAGLTLAGPRARQDREREARAEVAGMLALLTQRARLEGRLPCPDTTGDGVADGAPGACAAARGALPWVSMGAAPTQARDPWHRPLVYVVTPAATAPGALDCTAAFPDPGFVLISRVGAEGRGVLVAVVSEGANGALSPPPSVAEGLNRRAGAEPTLYGAPLATETGGFDDVVGALGVGTLRQGMGCPASPFRIVGSVPTTADALSEAAGVVWTPRTAEVLDSGQTTVSLPAGGPTLVAGGGTLAVSATGAGLGVWSEATPAGAFPEDQSGLEVTTTTSGVARTLALVWAAPVAGVTLSVSGLSRERVVPLPWRQSHDPQGTRCLDAVLADGSCRVAWIEGLALEAWRGDTSLGRLTLRACPSAPEGSLASFSRIAFAGGAFDRLRLSALPVIDGSGAVLSGESSGALLAGLALVSCAGGCPASALVLTGCP